MLIQSYLLQLGHACDPQWAYSPNTAWVCYIQCTGQKVTKLHVLLQPYLLQVMYMTFQYLTVSCKPAIGYVPNISR